MKLKSKEKQIRCYSRNNWLLASFVMVFLALNPHTEIKANEKSDGGAVEHTTFNNLSTNDLEEVTGVQQQKREITGIVKDDQGETVPGASVVVKGTSVGTITDINGKFSLMVDDQATVVVISFVGYKQQEITLGSQTNFSIVMEAETVGLEEIVAVGYGSQTKETLTGAITSISTESLVRSPNASVANTLAGQITGISTIQSSGQPGAEDPKIFVRGVGSLSESASAPLILVDGVEDSFFQMDPNEIESVTVLKDASATAVFGVRGANGVIIVTTRRGKEGTAKIQVNSSVGIQMPTRMLDLADSYTFASVFNEQQRNDRVAEANLAFSEYALDRFRNGDEPLLYPNIDWRKYLMNKTSLQTQHNVNISGGTKKARYFVSVGYLFQDGLMKDLAGLDYDNNYKYNRYNYRTNLDLNLTKSTTLQLGIGGVLGDTYSPNMDVWDALAASHPFSSPGVIDGKYYRVDTHRYNALLMDNDIMNKYYGTGYNTALKNQLSMNATLNQKLDGITKGLSVEVKAAYNSNYTLTKKRAGNTEAYELYYQGEIETPTLDFNDPSFNKTIVSKIFGKYSPLGYDVTTKRGRKWYMEGSLRYNRKFGNHNVGALALYNLDKQYYPDQFTDVASAYVGLVGRATYDYKSKYLAEFNVGYNGSENFAPDKRYGLFPAGSIGYVLSEENFLKNQSVINYLKLRASVGLVGNDNMANYRFLYLPDRYEVNTSKTDQWSANNHGYNFGYNNTTLIKGAVENTMGNPTVTWETSLKQNYGIDIYFLDSRLKVSGDYFREYRKDILIQRKTVPSLTGLLPELLPVVNMGEVSNRGYEIEIKWMHKVNTDLSYWAEANMSYAKNRIEFMDEVEPDFAYMRRTGEMVGAQYGYVTDGLFGYDDFIPGTDADGNEVLVLNPDLGYADPVAKVQPGDVKYKDLNNDGVIDTYDKKTIGLPKRPMYTFGLNAGVEFKGFFATMNWTGVTGNDVMLSDRFLTLGTGYGMLPQFLVDERWTPETATTAKMPRFTYANEAYNFKNAKDDGNDLALRDGSYIKLKNVSIGYKVKNAKVLKPIGAKDITFKMTGYNLLTFDYIKFMDPESNPNSNDTYPITKIYNLSVNVTF